MMKRTMCLGLMLAMTGIALMGCNKEAKTEEPVVVYTYETESDTREEYTTPAVMGETVGYSPALYMPVVVQKVTMEKTITETTTITPIKEGEDGEKVMVHEEAEVNETVLSESIVEKERAAWIKAKGYEGFPNGNQYDK